MRTHIKVIIAIYTILASSTAFAQIELPAVFGDNMVLQRDTMVRIWGQAAPGGNISISGSCMVSSAKAQADSSGKWSAEFKTKSAAGPYMLTVKDNSDNTIIKLNNILCGEVWLCSGQSNMEWPVAKTDNAKEEVAGASYPNIRLFHIPKKSSPDKQTDVDASWQECNPQNIPGFTAIGYFFGRYIHKELDVPIGLVESAWGGSVIDAWAPTEGYEGLGRLEDRLREIKQKTPGTVDYQSRLKKAIENVSHWQEQAADAMKAGCAVDDLPAISLNLRQGNHGIQGLYNAMIHPIIPYTIKGVLWYQGESNIHEGALYHEKQKALIGGWRQIWDQGDFPFYYVHLAPYKYSQTEALPFAWEAQLYSLNIPNTGMAVINDIGNYENIHPTNKQDVGKRLALWALAKNYDREDIVYSGPLFKSAEFKGSKAIVTFDHSGSGLTTRDGKAPDWFEVTGDDGKFYKAKATISGKNTVTVWADEVVAPTIVRLGWDQGATPNLMNKEGLPTPAFSSDIALRLPLPQGKNHALNKPYDCSDQNTHGVGWKRGLTNGSWAQDALNCFASNENETFPKNATIDLQSTETVSGVYIGVPAFGSTKTVQIELSTDGKDFKPVGKYVFKQKKSEKARIAFKPQQAHYVRVVYLDHYSAKVGYNPNFVFTTEVEVYSK